MKKGIMMNSKHIGTLVFLLVAMAAFFALPAAEGAYAAQDPVTYVDQGGTPHQIDKYTVLKGDEKEIGTDEGAWYVVNKNTTFENNLKVADGKKAKIIICKDVTLKCEDHLTVNRLNENVVSELAIYGEEKESGTLDVYGGWISGAAAMGGAENRSCGKIEIYSGKVKAYREGMSMLHGGAVIGGGKAGDGGQIYIYGGNVDAQNKSSGTGIGGGHYGAAGDIQISGGTVKVRAGNYGSGIGSGSDAGDKNNNSSIQISGGDVTAMAHSGGAGIGGGDHTPGGTIHITGGKVTASAARNSWIDCGAGIGGGNEANAGTIIIDGGYVDTGSAVAGMGCGEDCEPDGNGYTGYIYINGGTVIAEAASGAESAGIGGSNESDGCYVKITGGNVTAQGAGYNALMMSSSNGGAGIGGGDNGNGGRTEITGGTVKATGGYDGAGIGGGDHAKGGEILISGGHVIATGKIGGAGIGGGEAQTSGNITITGGTVEATGGAHNSWSGSGIGGGDAASGSAAGETIKISGGTVTAKGGNESAGIGGGDDGGAGNVVIDGGTVYAYGGKYAAGIGTGQDPAEERRGDGSLIINEGQVNAYGGTDAAGIGGGETMSGIKVTITGGTVYAEGKSYGAGIGGGEDSNGGDLTVSGGIVTAVAGDDCSASKEKGGSAIGCGQGVNKAGSDAESVIFGKLTIYDNAMVKVGDNVSGVQPVKTDTRKSDPHWKNCAQIVPCDHPDRSAVDTNATSHKIQCDYCGMKQESAEKHQWKDGKCFICGWEQPRELKVSFAAGEHGTGTMEAYMAYDGEKYALPSCGFEPASTEYEFAGWKVDDKSLKPGAKIEVTKDVNVTAEWKDAGTKVWTELQDKLVGSDALITLDSDMKQPQSTEYNALEVDRTVTLDLNGYVLDGNDQKFPILNIASNSSGNLTLKNGTLIGGNRAAINVNEDGSVFLQDCTVSGKEGYAGVQVRGNFSIAGRVSLDGTKDNNNNRDGGVFLENDKTINIAGPLSADSKITLSTRQTPKEDQPVVLTSGLEGKGELKCFSSSYDQYAVGENEQGEAILGIPTKISFDKGASEDTEHSMEDVNAVCGAVYKLPQCSYAANQDEAFKGWQVGSEIKLPGEKITVTKNLVLTAVYESAPGSVSVKIDAGEGHEAIAQKIAATLNEEGDGSAIAAGSRVTISMFGNTKVAKAEEDICAILKRAGITFDSEDGKSGNKWTKTVGLLPLSGYESIEAYRDAERQETEGTGAERIDKEDRTFYVHWYMPVQEVALTIEEPVCGTEVKLDEDYNPSVTPGLSISRTLPEGDVVYQEKNLWTTYEGRSLFEGVMTGGEDYEASSYIKPAFGYYFPSDVKVMVNGEKPEGDMITATELMLKSRIMVKAVHVYDKSKKPTWEWTGYESATATFTCEVDETHKYSIDAEVIKLEDQSSEATHTAFGKNVYRAAAKLHKDDPQPFTDTNIQLLPMTAEHEWGEPEYTWINDNTNVLAKRACTKDGAQHFETEVADVTGKVTKEPTCTEPGETTYSAEFENPAFEPQSIIADDIAALGHNWGEWKVDKAATETEPGLEIRTCSNEGCKETQTREIPPVEHSHGITYMPANPATCTENGNDEYWICNQGENPCELCFADEELTTIYDDIPIIPATGHDYQVEWKWSSDNKTAELSYKCRNDEKDAGTIQAKMSAEETAATCEKAGKVLYTATVSEGPDGKAYTDVREVELPKTGHKWGDWKKLDGNQHQRVCKNDPAHTETAEHTWDDGEVTVWPTPTSEGVKTFTCDICHATRTETIDKLDPIDPDEPIIPITADSVVLSNKAFVYNGSVQKPKVEVVFQGESIPFGYYEVTYSDENSVNAGEYTVTVKMKEGKGFSGDPVTKNYTIKKKELKSEDIELSKQVPYNGSEQRPALKVMSEGNALTEDRDYTVVWPEKSMDLGDYTVSIQGKGNCEGQVSVDYAIVKGDLKNSKVTLSKAKFTYNGKAQRPALKVTAGGPDLKEGTDYTVNWSNKNSTNAGTYKVTVTGLANYTGQASVSYTIGKAANTLKVKAKAPKLKAKKLKKKKQNIAQKKAMVVSGVQGKLTYTKVKVNKKKKIAKKFTINKKTGKITVKKGVKKGTYKMTIKVTASGNGNYMPAARTVTVKIKVK